MKRSDKKILKQLKDTGSKATLTEARFAKRMNRDIEKLLKL